MLIEALALAVNIILWWLLFLNLKKRLSPDGIVREAKKEVDGLLQKINSTTYDDISLLEARQNELRKAAESAKELCSEAEKRIAMLYGELDKAAAVRMAAEKAYAAGRQAGAEGESPRSEVLGPPSDASPSAASSGAGAAFADAASRPVGGKEASVAMPPPAALSRTLAAEAVPGPLFHEDTPNKSCSPLDSYRKEQLRFASGGAGGAAPAAGGKAPGKLRAAGMPEFVASENPIEVRKPFRQRVMEMRALGYSVEEIAHETGRSTQEVKITIEIS